MSSGDASSGGGEENNVEREMQLLKLTWNKNVINYLWKRFTKSYGWQPSFNMTVHRKIPLPLREITKVRKNCEF